MLLKESGIDMPELFYLLHRFKYHTIFRNMGKENEKEDTNR